MEPYDNPFWEKSNPAEREREREITPLIVDTKFRDSARKPLGPTNSFCRKVFPQAKKVLKRP